MPNKLDFKTRPTAEYSYFYYSDGGHLYFKTELERDFALDIEIQEYLDACDGWNEEVEFITVGKVSGTVIKVDVEHRPSDEDLDEDDCDGEGQHWDNDFQFKCNYKAVAFTVDSKGE